VDSRSERDIEREREQTECVIFFYIFLILIADLRVNATVHAYLLSKALQQEIGQTTKSFLYQEKALALRARSQ